MEWDRIVIITEWWLGSLYTCTVKYTKWHCYGENNFTNFIITTTKKCKHECGVQAVTQDDEFHRRKKKKNYNFSKVVFQNTFFGPFTFFGIFISWRYDELDYLILKINKYIKRHLHFWNI